MISLNDLSFNYQSKKILNNISHSFVDQRINQIKGPNGSGKTTLIRLIAGLITPKSGSIEGVAPSQIGYMPASNQSFLPNLTGRENLSLFFSYNKLVKKNEYSFFDEWESNSFFSEALKCKFSHCSDGMKQKVNFLRALIGDKDLLLMDEPFKFLDYESKEFLNNYLTEISKKKLIIFSSHQDFGSENILELKC